MGIATVQKAEEGFTSLPRSGQEGKPSPYFARAFIFHTAIHGIEKVLRLFAGLARKPSQHPELLRALLIDGLPGYISRDRGNLLQTTALDIRDGRIVGIYIVRNPDKLRHVAAAIGC